MPNTTRFLRQIRTGIFQVFIGDRVAAVLRHVAQFGDVPERYEIYVDHGDHAERIADTHGTAVDIARRLAEGEFDNDMRFEVVLNPEPSWQGDLYFVTEIATPSQQVVDSFTTEDGYGAVAAFREAQAFSLEERWAMDAEAGR